MNLRAQTPATAAAPAVVNNPAPATPATAAAPVTAQAPGQPAAPATPGQPGTPTTAGATPAGAAPAVKSAAPEDANPFSNVKTTDDRALKQELPVLEQRLKSMEDKMNNIQQVQLALPADALNGAGGKRSAGPGAAPGAGPESAEAMELEAATFVACVNGKAMFRDSDQKPFFVDAKEANQNEAVRRIGGCKH